jgi:hypothetical protein
MRTAVGTTVVHTAPTAQRQRSAAMTVTPPLAVATEVMLVAAR